MEIEILENEDAAACRAAEIIAGAARAAVSARDRFTLAVSGGRTPWKMLRALAEHGLPWGKVHVVQVDERVAPEGHPDRNMTHLRASLLDHVPLSPDHIHAMPVEASDLGAAARQYARALAAFSGSPPILDLVHLGLGSDGHTASLVPGDPVLDISDTDVGVTGIYQGTQRMTLTYPIINRSRRVLWVVTGGGKREALAALRGGDRSFPAGRVRRACARVVADRAAAPAFS
jgi:6-phosphogluconolactonase